MKPHVSSAEKYSANSLNHYTVFISARAKTKTRTQKMGDRCQTGEVHMKLDRFSTAFFRRISMKLLLVFPRMDADPGPHVSSQALWSECI